MDLEKYKITLSYMDRDMLEAELISLNRIRQISDDVVPKIRLILEFLK